MENQANNNDEVLQRNVMNSQSKGSIDLLFFNAQSLMSKIDELSIILQNRNPDIVGVVETWMDGSHGAEDFAFNNYSTEYKIRDKRPEEACGSI